MNINTDPQVPIQDDREDYTTVLLFAVRTRDKYRLTGRVFLFLPAPRRLRFGVSLYNPIQKR